MGVTADRRVDGRARERLAGRTLVAGWLSLVAVVPVALLAPEIPTAYRYLPLVASAIVFGMPHGAVDYVALPRAQSGRVTVRGVAVVVALYGLLGGGYLLAWLLVPVPAAALFILLTWFHWGQGDLYALRALAGADHVDDRLQQSLTVLVRGGLPMLVPLLAFPDRYRTVVDTFVSPFGADAGAWWLFQPGPRLALGGAFALVTVIALARGRARSGGDGGWRVDAGETGLLWAYFLLVSPVLAVGVYFCLWHSVRHIVRVVLLDERSVAAIAGGRWLPAVRTFALEAAVPTAIALGFVGLLWQAAPGAVETLAGASGLYLVAIAVLTLPHTAVVLSLDGEQGIWTRS
jgi:Brp/Blh family beta-carotene 15,15'-monooxygenase